MGKQGKLILLKSLNAFSLTKLNRVMFIVIFSREELCIDLFQTVENIIDLLNIKGHSSEEYKGFKRIKNIARSRDPMGFKNISRYLDSEVRMIYDHGLYNGEIKKNIEKAYLISEKLLD